MEVLDQFPVNYVCNCSKERFANAMLTLGAEEICGLPLNGEGKAEAVCHYCSRKYTLPRRNWSSWPGAPRRVKNRKNNLRETLDKTGGIL